MKNVFVKAVAAGLFCCCASFAQNTHQTIDLMVKHYITAKTFTLEVLDKMPDNGYSYKASEAEMSFGDMAVHIASANKNYCAAAFSAEQPSKEKVEGSKTAAVKAVTEAFDYCISGIQKLYDADLQKTVGKAPRQTTVFERLWGGFTHTAHHRAQLEVYLRLKGIQPPDYKF